MNRSNNIPKPLSPTGHGVRLDQPPAINDVLYGIAGRGKNSRVSFYTVVEVNPYIRKRDGEPSVVILFKDQEGTYWSSGLSTAKMTKHGKSRPALSDPFDTALAQPIGPNGMSVRLKHVPNIGDIFWTFPNNDNTKPKLYVKVTDVKPYISRADGTQKYLIAYTCKDNKIYSSQLESYKLVNLSDDPYEHRNAPYNQAKKKETQDA